METLESLVECYELSNEITSDYAYQLRYAVKRLRRYLAREPTLDDLAETTINRWLKHERDVAEIGDRSRANVRTSILTLWKRYGGVALIRDRIRAVKVTPKNPEAWTFEEFAELTAAAKSLRGHLANGVSRALYFETCLWFAYETGLRRGDVWAFSLDQFDGQFASLSQSKTKRLHVVTVTEGTLASMRAIAAELRRRRDPFARLPLRWPQSVSQFYYWMRSLRTAAGVDAETRNRSLQHVRRTGATQVECDGGDPWRFLGHSREGLDRKSYVDARKTWRAITPSKQRGA